MKLVSFNDTENIIQNYCITFTHNFRHQDSRFKNSFFIKAAEVDSEKAKKVAEILFPRFTDIEIVSIENDVNTLTPSEYDFIRGKLRDERQSHMRCQEHRIQEGYQEGPFKETEYSEYLLKLIKKMETRIRQFPLYHT